MKRSVIYTISFEFLESILLGTEGYKTDAPADLKVVGANVDGVNWVVELRCESKEFEPLRVGQAIPRRDLLILD
jgi:hypothetical protein